MFEYIDDIVLESSYNTMKAMFEVYNKALMLEAYGFQPANTIFQESDIPERKTTLEKVIWFIPDMIRKFIQLIKSKLKKLFGKKPDKIANNIKKVIVGSKDDKNRRKKIIAILAAAGVTAAASATGYIIYNKHKKNILAFEEDSSGEINVDIVYDIPNMIESLKDSIDVSADLIKLYSSIDTFEYKSEYKSITTKLRKASKSLSKAIKPANKGKVYTVQQLTNELKQLSDSIDEIDKSSRISNGQNRSFYGLKKKYMNDADKLNVALSEWSNEFNQFMTKTSDFISTLNSTIETFESVKDSNDSSQDTQKFDNPDIIKRLESMLQTNGESGNKNSSIRKDPVLHTRTFTEDFHFCIAPDDVERKTLYALLRIISKDREDRFDYRSPGFTPFYAIDDDGNCLAGYYFTPLNNAEEFNIPLKRFKDKRGGSSTCIEYFTDIVGRNIYCFSGYYMNLKNAKAEDIPPITHEECFNMYMDFQRKHFYDETRPNYMPTEEDYLES